MTNAQRNSQFLNTTDEATRNAILANIAAHYGITSESAFEEVTDADAEHLLDYVTREERYATSLLMKRHGL